LSRWTQFNLLVVRGDGARVLRLRFPRRLAFCALAVAGLGSVGVTALAVDYFQLRHLIRGAVTFRDESARQRATIDSFNQRVADLRREVVTWRELHARILEPFGPGTTPRRPMAGIGGGTAAAVIPGASSPLDELQRLAETVTEEGENLRALDRLIGRAGKALASLPSRWPVRGPVNSEFGTRHSAWTKAPELHSGLDIGADRGTPVKAPSGGTVAFAGAHQDYGLTVMIDHGNDLKTIYGHLSKLGAAVGSRVERGAVIGYTGNTGRSSGPHLHYEILVKGQPANPRAFLWD
jgi:murein DD-endopeptidase MepM/ murein hydrolase activator NlpD